MILAGKKILFVITKSNWGGAQAYVYALATHCAGVGAHVTVALGGTGGVGADTGLLAEKLAAQDIRVVVLTSFARDISLMRECWAFRELYRVIRHEQPDIIHVNSSKAGGLGALAARSASWRRKRPIRIIFTAHGFAHREPRPLVAKALIWFASWVTILLSHDTIAVSACDRQHAPALFLRRRIHLIRNGIAPFPLIPRVEARRALQRCAPRVSLEGLWLLLNGELHPNKGIDVALRAFARIARAHPDLFFVVMGSGQEHERLERLIAKLGISERAFLLGFVPNGKQYLRAADIFTLPSRKEGLPLAILEAGIAELPVVATRTGGIPEIISDRSLGILVPVEDVEALAQAYAALADDADARVRLGAALHTKVLREFSEETMFAATTALYA